MMPSINTKEKNNPFAVNLYVMGYNADKHLSPLNIAVKQNVKTYLNELGHNSLKTFGYDLNELISQIDNLPSARGGFIVDRIYKLTGDLLRLTDAQMFKRKIRHRINSGDSFFPLR